MSMARTGLAAAGLVIAAVALIPALLVAVPFFAAAGVTRFAESRRRQEADAVSWRQLVEYTPEIGWRPRANMDVYGHADEAFRLTTGPDGWRGTGPVSEADMVVFGDSFAFGHGAEDDEMYTNFCAGLNVKPIGSDGYSMVHALMWMRRFGTELAGKLVVWFVYCGNDLHEALLPNMGRYRMPFVRERGDDWEIVTDHVDTEPWPFPSSHNYHEWLAEMSCPTPTSDRVFSAADYLIRQAHEVCTRAGARLLVVSVPMRVQLSRRGQAQLAALAPDRQAFDVDRMDAKLRESCDRLNVPFVALKQHLSPGHYLLKDIHWTRQGHRRVGQLLTRLYDEVHGDKAEDRVGEGGWKDT